MRRALIAAVVTSGVVAARRRRPAPLLVPFSDPVAAPLPAQRAPLVEGDAELSVEDQQAQDDRILALIDRL